jgi:phosphomannomutase/phosphoglucomutase
MINPDVFREYDIRGVVGADLDDDFAGRLGRALGVYFVEHGVRRVSLGMDARLSSPGFRRILGGGLTESGVDVVDLGMVPTPVMYFSLFRLDVGGGVEVTGSHNPPDNNGFKIALGKTTIYGDEIRKIRSIMEEGRVVRGRGRADAYDIVPEYVHDIVSRIRPGGRRLRVVIDPGNGVGGPAAMAVCEALGVDASGICLEPDGRFPNHHPDPTTAQGLSMLRDEVLRTGADLGIGYDGDADRIGVIDSRGGTVYGDMITAILAREILGRNPGARIIGEVKCSKVFFDEVARLGGVPVMGRVGHSPMKARLMAEQAALAGEMSGHIFFLDRWYGFDDAIYATARLLELLSRHERPQEVFDALPRVINTPEIRVDCPDGIKFEAVERFARYARGTYDQCVDIDGVRFTKGDSWGLVRPSNTQPVVVMRFEAKSAPELEAIERDTRLRLNDIIGELSAGG